MISTSLLSMPKSKDEGGGELQPGSHEVHAADSLDDTESEVGLSLEIASSVSAAF